MKKVTTLKVINFAKEYGKNITKIIHNSNNGKKVCFYANNKEVSAFLIKDFDVALFKKLFALCDKKGVFDLRFCNHIPSVTFSAGAKHMTRKWPRDHMGMMPLVKDKYAEQAWKGLEEWAKTYNQATEIRAFDKVFKNPEKACCNMGVSHVFWQLDDGSLIRDAGWKMRQRIESHGELLRYLAKYSCNRLMAGKSLSDDVVRTIVRFGHYLYIQGLSPQSCGAWEEIPFANGINWDNASVMKAFEEVVLLIEVLKKHPKIKQKFEEFEDIICRKFGLIKLFEQTEVLNDFIKKSLRQIRRFYLDEFHGATKRTDSSSVMLCAEDIDLSLKHNLVVDVRKHLQILKRWEKNLVREFGALRYNHFSTMVDGHKIVSCDSYLNLNYYILCDYNGRLCARKENFDTSVQNNDNDVSNFMRRGKNSAEKTSAQWGLPLSYAAIAYGKLTAKLLNEYDKKGTLTKREQELLQECFNKNQEYIKRTYANISGCFDNGEKFLKADGNIIEAFHKPEAYQAVTTELNTNKFGFIPGVNDHLGWDAAKCYEASKLFLGNLERIEKNNLL